MTDDPRGTQWWVGRGICLACHHQDIQVVGVRPGGLLPPWGTECPACHAMAVMGQDVRPIPDPPPFRLRAVP